MALNNASIVAAPSSISVTGGSAVNFVSAGAVSDAMRLIVPTDADFRTRRSIDFSVKVPKVNSSSINGYTLGRARALYKQPKLLANGKIVTNTVALEIAYDFESTDVEVQRMLDTGAQLFFDTDFTSFWKYLSLG